MYEYFIIIQVSDNILEMYYERVKLKICMLLF